METTLKHAAVEILPSGGRCCHYVGHKRFIVGHVVYTQPMIILSLLTSCGPKNNLASGIHLVFECVVKCRREGVGSSRIIIR